MKKRVLILSFAMMLMAGSVATGQDQPKPKKDTVNIDTDAKPTFYYAAEDEAAESKGNTTTIVIIAGVAVILAGGFFLVLKRKK
ncbi:MAG: LPXTG cell wall anchor domain-containing protein [Bacteroidetes bacterium]|nr:LPXTG cell wall anchor domain-containing protein [Bacteroidota bacterium]